MKKFFIMAALLPLIACSDNLPLDEQVAKCAGSYVMNIDKNYTDNKITAMLQLLQRADNWLLKNYNKTARDYPIYSATLKKIIHSEDSVDKIEADFSFCNELFEKVGIY